MLTVRVVIAPPPLDAEQPLGLLFPEPPRTAEQIFVGYEAPSRWRLESVAGANNGQRAMFTTVLPRAEEDARFVFKQGAGRTPDEVFRRFDNAFTEAPPALREAVEAETAAARAPREAVRRIVDFIAGRFDYGPRNPELTTPRHVGEHATGNCIDINTVLLASLQAAGIEASYRAGFYFEAAEAGTRADGMHCWVTSRVGGREDHWDIAHCLKAGRVPVRPALNPAGGLRVAFSAGRGLTFALGDLITEPISHFARPHWVYADGGVAEADITTTLHACDAETAAAFGGGIGAAQSA